MVNRRPEADADPVLLPAAKSVLEAMERAGTSALDAYAAGRRILDAVVHDEFGGVVPRSSGPRSSAPPRLG